MHLEQTFIKNVLLSLYSHRQHCYNCQPIFNWLKTKEKTAWPPSAVGSEYDWVSRDRWFEPQSSHILSLRFGHEKKILQPFSAIHWFKKGSCQLLAKEWALVLVNCLGGLPRNSEARLNDHVQMTLNKAKGCKTATQPTKEKTVCFKELFCPHHVLSTKY